MSLRRNALWNLAGAGVPLLVGATLIPYTLRGTGVEAFGILTLIWALMGYFSLFDFGLGRALTQQVSRQLAIRDGAGDLRALVKSGLVLATATGALGGIVLALTASPLAENVLKVSPGLRMEVFHALLIAAAGVPLTTVTVGMRGVLEAYEDFKSANVLRMCLGIGTFGVPAVSVYFLGPSLVLIVCGLMVLRLLVAIAHWRLVRKRVSGDFAHVRLRPAALRGLLALGAWMTVSNIVSPLMVTADRFVISAVLGASIVAYYAVPSELIARALVIPGALTGALFPRLASLLTDQVKAAKSLYLQCLLIVTAVLLPICTVLAFGAHWGLSVWLGNVFADRAAATVAILSFGLLLNGVALVPYAAVQAAGLAHITAKLHLLEALFYFPLLMWGLARFGIEGAAMAWTARVGIDLALLAWAAHRWVFRESRQQLVSPALRHNFGSIDPQRTETP